MGSLRVSDIARLAASDVEEREEALRKALDVDVQRGVGVQTWLLGALVAVPIAILPVYFAADSKMPAWILWIIAGFVVIALVALAWQWLTLRKAARMYIHSCVLLHELEAVAPLLRQFHETGGADE